MASFQFQAAAINLYLYNYLNCENEKIQSNANKIILRLVYTI